MTTQFSGAVFLGDCRVLAALLLATTVWAAAPARAGDYETGPNVSGESTGMERKRLLQEQRQNESVHIEVPRGPDGLPQKPVRGLSRAEKMEMDDLEFRYQMGQISEAEYTQRHHDMMKRVGLEPEF